MNAHEITGELLVEDVASVEDADFNDLLVWELTPGVSTEILEVLPSWSYELFNDDEEGEEEELEENEEPYMELLLSIGWKEIGSGSYSWGLVHPEYPGMVLKLYNQDHFGNLDDYGEKTIYDEEVLMEMEGDDRIPRLLARSDYGCLMTQVQGKPVCDFTLEDIQQHLTEWNRQVTEYIAAANAKGWVPVDLNLTNVYVQDDNSLHFIDFNRYIRIYEYAEYELDEPAASYSMKDWLNCIVARFERTK